MKSEDIGSFIIRVFTLDLRIDKHQQICSLGKNFYSKISKYYEVPLSIFWEIQDQRQKELAGQNIIIATLT